MSDLNMDAEVKRFKMELLRKMPFYGDIVLRLPFTANPRIPTARTDGGKIEYNPAFFSTLSPGQRNFVLMHEVFHVLLFHCKRKSERDPRLWNTAADMIVNSMLQQLAVSMRQMGIPFERPKDGIFATVFPAETVETKYEQLLADNRKLRKNAKTVRVRLNTSAFNRVPVEMEAPDDIVLGETGPDGAGQGIGSGGVGGGAGGGDTLSQESLSEPMLLQIIRESSIANRSSMGSYFVPDRMLGLTESKRLKWQTLLRDFFTEEQSDESSYTTPERKYLHMDLILPGYSLSARRIEEIWAFVDSSGSVGNDTMKEFLTQLYRIAKELKCVFNVCYWDTEVTDVYKKILREEDILKSLPHHSGGTDINCVYRWIREKRVKPDVMLVLTDGYFGTLDKSVFQTSLGKKTVLVLSGNVPVNDDMKRIGKIARLQ